MKRTTMLMTTKKEKVEYKEELKKFLPGNLWYMYGKIGQHGSEMYPPLLFLY